MTKPVPLYFRVAMICLMLLVGNIVLLVGSLTVFVLNPQDRDDHDSSER